MQMHVQTSTYQNVDPFLAREAVRWLRDNNFGDLFWFWCGNQIVS